MGTTHYVALNYDEVSILNNQTWLSIHCYVVKNYIRIPIIISLDQMLKGLRSNNLAKMIMDVLVKGGDLP
jgi:hypothetical protein